MEDRDKLVQQKVRLPACDACLCLPVLKADRLKADRKADRQNQLRSTLIAYFPQAVEAFSDLTTQTALEFLSQFPTFAKTQGRTEEEWNVFLDKNRCFHPQARHRFLTAMKQKPIIVDDAVVKAKSLFVQTIVQQMKVVVTSLKEYNKQISTLLLSNDDGFLFRTLPGVDVILAAKLLVSIGTDRNRFTKVN